MAFQLLWTSISAYSLLHKFGWMTFDLHIRRRSNYIIGSVTQAIGPNKSKKLTRLISPVHNIRGKVWMKSNIHGFTDNKLLCVKPWMLFFIQTFPLILCAGAMSRVSFLDLFGPIAGAINPIMYSLLRRIEFSFFCMEHITWPTWLLMSMIYNCIFNCSLIF